MFALLAGKGQAVGASFHGGIAFVRTNLDLIQRAVILQIAVMCALTYRTFDSFIGLTTHFIHLPFLSYAFSIPISSVCTLTMESKKQSKSDCFLFLHIFRNFCCSFPNYLHCPVETFLFQLPEHADNANGISHLPI